MIQIKISNKEKRQLEEYRGHASSKNSEKALMVIMNSEGMSPVKIAQILKRNSHTVRKWLKRYHQVGEKGLERLYSQGRPNLLREKVKICIREILDKSPYEFGYQDRMWTVALMVHYINSRKGFNVSEDTVERSLKDMGYTYKRPSKRVSLEAPSRDEKLEKVSKIVDEIRELSNRKDCEVLALDESYFSTEPYLVRGWQKKRWPPEDTLSSKKRKTHVLWLLESTDKKILLEKIGEG